MGNRHPDLLTRYEVALLLGVSVSVLAKGWGPPRLAGYRRPVMYSRAAIDQWIANQPGGSACSTNSPTQTTGGRSLSTTANGIDYQRVRQIEKQRRSRLAASASKSSSSPALVSVSGQASR